MVEGYLKNRTPLRRIFLLVDIRHEPTANDRMIHEWCTFYGLPLTVVATKADKLSRNQIAKQLGVIKKTLETAAPIPFSSETRQGRDALWASIIDSCGPGML
jgi:GTP-binding protein